MKKQLFRTDFLFPKSSFWMGVGSLLGLFSPFYTFNTSDTERSAYYSALENDFVMIGQDIAKAMASLNNYCQTIITTPME